MAPSSAISGGCRHFALGAKWHGTLMSHRQCKDLHDLQLAVKQAKAVCTTPVRAALHQRLSPTHTSLPTQGWHLFSLLAVLPTLSLGAAPILGADTSLLLFLGVISSACHTENQARKITQEQSLLNLRFQHQERHCESAFPRQHTEHDRTAAFRASKRMFAQSQSFVWPITNIHLNCSY